MTDKMEAKYLAVVERLRIAGCLKPGWESPEGTRLIVGELAIHFPGDGSEERKDRIRELAEEIVDMANASHPNGRSEWATEPKNMEPVYGNAEAMIRAVCEEKK